MYNISFFKKMLLLASIILLYSCDKDYNGIGGDLIGDNHFGFTKYTSNVIAYNQKTGPIQSNNMPVNALGIIDNPVFGKTTANFATQLTLSTAAPVIGVAPVVDSVYITVPYFSHITTTNADGSHIYELDSVYANDKSKIKLSVYRSGIFMGVDPASGDPQKYFTNQNSVFDNAKVDGRLNDAGLEQNDEFFFDSKEIVTTTKDASGKDVVTRTAPGIRLRLNAQYFQEKILDASGNLTTNDIFKNYFKGLYFKVEDVAGSSGNMALLDFSKGSITINYKAKTDITTDADDVKDQRSLVLNLTGNTVSLLNNDFGSSGAVYGGLPDTGNITDGDEKIYLKGGEGSMAVLNLFSKPGELEDIRAKGWLINEANLVFHIDTDAMSDPKIFEPNRIYLYDLTNNLPLIDCVIDPTTNSVYPKKSKYIFDGNINYGTNGRGLTYKIRITEQIKSLIKNNPATANVKLGLVVMEDINNRTSYQWQTPINVIPQVAPYGFQTPMSSVMNPLGTVLRGSNSTVTEDKRLKLEIFYTKLN